MPNDFTQVTPENAIEIQERLQKQEGKVVIAEYGYQSFPLRSEGWKGKIIGMNVRDVRLDLYDSPLINISGEEHRLFTERGEELRGGVPWQTGWEKDRQYLLKEIPEPTGDDVWDGCRELFKSLRFGNYKFEIGLQATTGRGLFSGYGVGLTMFVPKTKSLAPAFREGLMRMVAKLNACAGAGIEKRNIEEMIQYMTHDLETGEVLAHNVEAGLDADFALGMQVR